MQERPTKEHQSVGKPKKLNEKTSSKNRGEIKTHESIEKKPKSQGEQTRKPAGIELSRKKKKEK